MSATRMSTADISGPNYFLPFKLPRKRVEQIRGYHSFDKWERAYHPYLVDMFKLFVQKISDGDPSLEDRLINFKTFKKFRAFVYEKSSGNISMNLPDLND